MQPFKSVLFRVGFVALLGASLYRCGDGDSDDNSAQSNGEVVTFEGALKSPDDWSGTWQLTLSFRTCQSQHLVAVDQLEELICPGQPLGAGLVPLLEDCRATVAGDSLVADCGQSFTILDCQVQLAFDLGAERRDATLEGQGQWSTTLMGSCDQLGAAACETVTIEGIRLSDDISACGP